MPTSSPPTTELITPDELARMLRISKPFTFRHTVGTNNFAARDLFLGTEIGSDVDRLSLGLRLIFPQRFIFNSTIAWLREGEENIRYDIYRSYEGDKFRKGAFPSGVVQHTRFVELQLAYSLLRNIEIKAFGHFSNSRGRLHADQNYVIFSLNGYLPWRFGL